MDPALRPLRVNTVDLLRQPGDRRVVTATIPIDSLSVHDARATGDVSVTLLATSTVDGILVTGTIGVPHDEECRRCLRPVHLDGVVEIDELFVDGVADGVDAFEIGSDALDLADTVRDAVLLTLADPPPLCRPECPGLCPVCGRDLTDGTCECDTTVRDERWAALDQLRLDAPDD